LNTQAQIEVPAAPLRAQAYGGGAGGIFGSPIFFLVAMLLLMWALLIRPQQRKDKEHKAMLSQVEKGDAVHQRPSRKVTGRG
jgi:preprotein translocase subunit YajC